MARSVLGPAWLEMFTVLARTDRLQSQGPGLAIAWEPPIDILETEIGLIVIVALPGVERDDIEVAIEGGELFVRGIRRWPCPERPAQVYRIELPHGRFERRLQLPSGAYQVYEREQKDGCLILTMRRIR